VSSIKLIVQYMSPDISDLSGCVADAQSIERFLMDNLKVPADQIYTLADETATRQAILQALQTHFEHNHKITKGDAMLFYFAGHGSQFHAPPGWTTDDGKVETITPYDESVKNNVYGIPDRTLSALLRRTAENHGNNITTILDCCHSGSGTRDKTEGTVRGHENETAIPAELDREILGGFRHASAFLGGSLSSHVLLSACRQVLTFRHHEGTSLTDFLNRRMRKLVRSE
jgi:hypothetical protein